jgi:hypothetical protein
MLSLRKALAGSLALALCVGAPAMSRAQATAPAPAAAPTSEAERLGAQLAGVLLDAIDLKGALRQGMSRGAEGFAMFKSRPEWRTMLLEAMAEEFAAKRTQIAAVIGRSLARKLSEGELRAGVALLTSPGVADYIAEAARKGGEAGEPPAAVQRAMQRTVRTAEGRDFLQKFSRADEMLTPEDQEAAAIIVVPGAFQRFGQRAEAAEAARARP